MLSEKEKKAIEDIEKTIKLYNKKSEKEISVIVDNFDIDILNSILKLVNRQKEQLETIKEYAYQEIVHYTEDIRDYIDDDKERNKYIIGKLKEDREHWKDIEKILQNKPKEELYMNWWEVGLYE